MSATTAPASSLSTSATTTLAPSPAKIRAMLAPIPDAAPVISATLFSSLIDDPPLVGPLRSLDDPNLPPQFAREQAFRDHRVNPAHDVDDLGDAKADGDARQRIGVVGRQLRPRRQKSDRVARRQRHRRV